MKVFFLSENNLRNSYHHNSNNYLPERNRFPNLYGFGKLSNGLCSQFIRGGQAWDWTGNVPLSCVLLRTRWVRVGSMGNFTPFCSRWNSDAHSQPTQLFVGAGLWFGSTCQCVGSTSWMGWRLAGWVKTCPVITRLVFQPCLPRMRWVAVGWVM